MLEAIWAPPIAFVVAVFLLWCLTRAPLARLALDQPNERSLHKTPIPRSGGLGLHAGVMSTWLISEVDLPLIVLFCFVLLFAVSAMDDRRGLPAGMRFATHMIASTLTVTYVLSTEHGWVSAIAIVFALTWMINLYNFMDGSDGLAAGMALIGFSCYGIAAVLAGDGRFAALNFGIAAAAVAFLLFNFHPARIFLGDSGSIPLGFLAGSLGFLGWLKIYWPWWFPIVVFSPFIADASLTLAKRAWTRARIWQAHREHYYQRLVRMGWGHRRTALAEYGLMSVSACVALLSLRWPAPAQIVLISVLGLIYITLALKVDQAWRKHTISHES